MKTEHKTLIKYILNTTEKSLTAKQIYNKLINYKYVNNITTKEIANYLNRTNIKNLKKEVVYLKTDKNNKYEKKTIYKLN